MAREKQHRIGKEMFVVQRDLGFLFRGVDGGMLPDKREQVGDFCWAIVPVASAIVLEAGNGECRGRVSQLSRAGRGNYHQEKKKEMAHGF